MILIAFKEQANVVGVQIPAHKEYVYPRKTANLIQERYPQLIEKIRPLGVNYRKYKGQNLSGKKLLLWRTGGFGDILLITPLVRQLKESYPNCEINFGCMPAFSYIFYRNRNISKIYGLPVPLSLLKEHNFHLHFQGTIEKSNSPKLHACDLFANHAGVTLKNKNTEFHLPPDVLKNAETFILEELKIPKDQKKVAIQVKASSVVRSYPGHLLKQVLALLTAKGLACVLIGLEKDRIPGLEMPGVFPAYDYGKTVLDAVALFRNCDVLLSPDSSMTHFAGALSFPNVALYGPFPGQIRTKYYSNCTTLEVHSDCAPCLIPSGKPCHEAEKIGVNWSPCFETLKPETVVETIMEKLGD